MDRLWNEHETAEYLCLSVKTLRRWRWAKRGPSWLKLSGGAVRYDPVVVIRYVAGSRVEGDKT